LNEKLPSNAINNHKGQMTTESWHL